MWARLAVRWQLLAALVLGAAVLVTTMGLSYWSALRFKAADQHRLAEQRLFTDLALLYSHLQSAESHQRAYLLTGQTDYLQGFAGAAGAVRGDLVHLRRSLASDSAALGILARLDRLSLDRLAGLEDGIARWRREGPASAAAAVAGGVGTARMDSVRAEVVVLRQELLRHAAGSEATVRRLSALMLATIPVAGMLAVLFLVGAGLRVGVDLSARERAEAEAQAARLETEDLYDNAPCGYHSLDADGRIVRVNLTEARWLGYSREELVGRPVGELMTPASRAGLAARYARFLEDGVMSGVEVDLLRRDGTILPVTVTATAVRDAAGRFVMSRSTLHDVSALRAAARELESANLHLEAQVQERTAALRQANEELQAAVEELRAAEEELRQQNDGLVRSRRALELSEHRLRTALRHLPQIVYHQDLDLRYTWIMNTPARFPAEEVLGRTDLELLGPTATEYVALKRQVLATGRGMRREVALEIDGGTVVYETVMEPLRDPAGRIVGLTGAAIDITERQRQAQEQHRAHEHLQALIAASPQALVALDRERRVVNWYGGAERMFGWSAAEVLGRPLPVVPPESEAEYHRLSERVFQGELLPSHQTLRRRKDGTLVPVSVSSAPLHDSLGNVTGLVAVYTDLTEFRRAEEERRGREIAEAANRSKSQFLANMSHELRTPLNAIIGFSELLEDQAFGELNPRQARYVGNILTSGRHLLELINDILDLAKVEAGRLTLDPAIFDAANAIGEVRRIVEPLAMAKRLTLEVEIVGELPLITADRPKFKQILYNLLSNAIKFTPEGGRVTVRARGLPVGAGPGASEALEVAVQDTGIGIHPDDHARVFNEFEQLDSSYARQQPGTGLGLALTRRLIALQGGTVSLVSALGAGSTFTVLLPLLPPALRSDTGELPAFPAQADTRPLVLVVEDDPVAGELLGHYLSANGYAVAHAWNGAQALEAAQALQPAAITLDILLPDEDGLEILSRLRSLGETQGIPVVVVSITDDRELGLSLGAVDWLVKPIQRDQLLDALESAIPARPMAHATRVLVVDDHRETVDLLAETLTRRGFAALRAYGGAEGLEVAKRERPDAIVLDLVMPGVGGIEAVRALRRDPATREIPVLVFTYKQVSEEERAQLDGQVHTIISKSEAGTLLLALQRLARRVSGPRARVRDVEPAG